MKTIKIFFRALFPPTRLGVVMFLLAATIFVVSLKQASVPFDATLERTEVLNRLQNKIAYALMNMQIQEAYESYVLIYQAEEGDFIQYAESADANLSQEMEALEAEGHFGSRFPYATDLSASVQAFNATRTAHRETFNQSVETLRSGGQETEAVLAQLEADNQTLNSQLSDLILSVKQDRLAAQQDFPEDVNQAIITSVVGLTLSLLLALLGYQFIIIAVRPLRTLRNVITAIGGDRYRPELQGALLNRRGSVGKLAQALDALAKGERARTEGLKAETDRLRQELYESRRRRLKVFHPAEAEED